MVKSFTLCNGLLGAEEQGHCNNQEQKDFSHVYGFGRRKNKLYFK